MMTDFWRRFLLWHVSTDLDRMSPALHRLSAQLRYIVEGGKL